MTTRLGTIPPMTEANLVGALKSLGWNPKGDAQIERALKDFQRGWAMPGQPALLIDGKNGPKTRNAVRWSLNAHKAGKPTASKSFSFREFRCTCGGRYTGCALVRVHRDLLIGLEVVRDLNDKPLSIVSGYRCQARNQAVGGASSSQHVLGAAADIVPVFKTLEIRRLRRFGGIGYQKASGKVRHVDVRHVSGNNTTGGTPGQPTIWIYP